jgi:hypothetical protein
MAKFTNPLANVRVASPCPANWDEMVGDERKRFCGQCKLNVYNLSGMPRDEAENLLLNAEGRLCVRFYRRTDGLGFGVAFNSESETTIGKMAVPVVPITREVLEEPPIMNDIGTMKVSEAFVGMLVSQPEEVTGEITPKMKPRKPKR